MKKVKDSQNDIIIIAFVFGFIAFVSVANSFTVQGYVYSLMLFVLFVIGYIPKHYNFEYNSERIVIRNSWNPFFYREFSIKNIGSVKFINALYMGGGICFILKNGRKYNYSTSVKRTVLEEAIREIEGFTSINEE